MKTTKQALLTLVAFCLVPMAANAGPILVTDPNNDSVLVKILGFDAGPLGIVDIDFAGRRFNDAFGHDPSPAGFLFAATQGDALTITEALRNLLNTYNSTAATPVTQVYNSVYGFALKQPAMDDSIFVAFAVTASDYERYRLRNYGVIQPGSSSWDVPSYRPSASRTKTTPIFARMTASAMTAPAVEVSVPEPGTAVLFGACLVGLALTRRKKKVQA